ncbi:MAG: NAD(P)/FAD-dependent oxidoreductase, partial [Trichodesmium sp. St17_bin3_1_1]|nr:NAD(P)/FAD-dependent oxidoreductase [Trichodesmium sp. St17_bin3_1_1]
MSFPPLKIIVVGGGAAGFFGALVAAPHNHVNILEAGQQPLAKV